MSFSLLAIVVYKSSEVRYLNVVFNFLFFFSGDGNPDVVISGDVKLMLMVERSFLTAQRGPSTLHTKKPS